MFKGTILKIKTNTKVAIKFSIDAYLLNYKYLKFVLDETKHR